MSDSYITVAEAADRIGVNHKTIRRAVATGRITGYRVGDTSLIRLLASEVDALLRPIPTAGNLPDAREVA
jgi:excisionase family DNA binding protein